jgi:hypothetical protein
MNRHRRESSRSRTYLPSIAGTVLVLAALSLHVSDGAGIRAQSPGPCAPPNGNPIVCENALAGNPSSEWDISGAGDSTIQGFATDISVNRGQTVSFKIDTDATNYRLDIYRMGYYNGFGARKVATVNPSVTLPQNQPTCLTDAATGLVDCGNWIVSASWAVPSAAVSGIYFAKVIRTDTGGASHIVFIVRDDAGQSDLLFQTSDTTWQAYNQYGGNSLYVGSPAGRAYKVSYNRPFTTRGTGSQDWLFNAEYPMVRWLESNGYNVSYFTGVDSDRIGAEVREHKVFLSVGHDEYWSGAQRTNVEAARAAGVHLAFLSGNEIFWKTRWENSISAPATPYRTLVSYKETHADAKIDPLVNVWTGTWADPRFSPPADGGKPQNALSGTMFTVNCCTTAVSVPAADGKMRFWRNTTIANQAAGGVAALPDGTLGYEWDSDLDNGFRPAGLFRLSETQSSQPGVLADYGSTYQSGTANHALTLYRHPSGALVFGAGTVQWSWGLDGNHDRGSAAPSLAMQQATLNLFADMGVQPLTLQAALVPAVSSTDATAPTSTITSPAHGSTVLENTVVTISGIASDGGGGLVGGVEVTVDGGATWRRATGREAWTYSWQTGTARTVAIFSRAVDDSGNLEQPVTGISVNVTVGSGGCPCSLWTPSQVPPGPADVDGSQVELGTRFRSDVAGYVTGIRFYKDSQNTGAHVGSLWTAGGARLSTVTFSGESASGWQEATFPSPVQIAPNTLYVVSYNASLGVYAATGGYFTATGANNGPLHAPRDGTEGGANGVYRYGSNVFPNQTYQSTNYWVDVVFATATAADTTPPLVNAVGPANGSSTALPDTAITATFNENVTNVTNATFELTNGSLIPATVAYSAGTRTATLTPSSPLAYSTTYTVRLKSGAGGIADIAGNPLAADYVWSFTTVPSSSLGCPCTIWPSTQVPGKVQEPDSSGVELGVKFRTSVNGFITGVRFYKGALNTGVHVGNLWTGTGTLLSTVTFINESASGWQTASFAQPIAVTANSVYVISYHAPNGFYSVDNGYFATTRINGPLEAVANGTAGGNGVYRYGPAAFPTDTFGSSNYWVDVVFDTMAAPDTTAPAIAATSPAANASNAAVTGPVTVRFNEALNGASVNSSTFELRDAAANLVGAAVSYDQLTREARLQPTIPLAYSSSYSPTIKGGANGVRDLAGNALAANYTWTFTTRDPPPPPPDEGPGGPIMLVSSTANPFTKYYAEVLRAEGLNGFVVSDITAVTASTLAAHDVVVLGEMALTAAQVNMFADWVSTGGKLIAMRPDKQLAGLLGLTAVAGALRDAYLKIDTSTAPGAGIVADTMQFHGTADLYALNGATPVAMLYSDAASPTSAPAVTLRTVGGFGGQAAAFAYDLARSVVSTRQGNPAWAGQERDGFAPIRPDDLFFGGTQADYVDRTKIAIPQADEQQRLLANLIIHLTRDKRPLPRFWYFPHGYKAVVVMTGDDHANNGTTGQFDYFKSRSTPGCSVADWECIRSTSYIYNGTPITPAQVAAYTADGFEIALHTWMSGSDAGSSSAGVGCHDYTTASIRADYQQQLAAFNSLYPAAVPARTNRTHCLVWSDYSTQPETALANGIRLDTTYYYWPSTWVNNLPGVFTGSAMPMRFAKPDGSMFDVYQAPTQMTDESGQTYPFTADTLLNRALGPEGYFGAYVTNMHTDNPTHPGAQAIVASAQARGVPVISAKQLLDWLDGRNGATYTGPAWVGSSLTFSISADAKANGLQTLLPAASGSRLVAGIMRNGQPIPFTLQSLKGVNYVTFDSPPGAYDVQYVVDNTAPTITALAAAVDAFEATVTWTTSENATSRVVYGTSPNGMTSSAAGAGLGTSQSVRLTGLTAGSTYYFRAMSTDVAGNIATAPAAPAPPMQFTTLTTPTFGCPCTIWSPAQAPLLPSGSDASAIEVGTKFRPAVDGYVTAIRFYKGAPNTGTHVGNLWKADGTLLGTTTYANESATGWQEAALPQPVAVAANATYIVSYHTTTGRYAVDNFYFQTSGVTNGPLQALAEGVSGSNGVYRYGASSGFPSESFNSTNYWVDLKFVVSLPPAFPPSSVTDTTAADFDAGTPGPGTHVARMTDGEVILTPSLAEEFSGSTLPAGWSSAPWAAGGASSVAGDQVTVNGALLGSDTLVAPGRSLEFVATFSGEAFQNGGFGLSFNENLWAMFTTGQGGGLWAKTHDGATPIDTPIQGNWLGSPHRYGITWTSTSVAFSIDGAPVASHSTTIGAQMRPAFSDVSVGATGLIVDSVAMSPYATSGTFTSRVLDGSVVTNWSSAVSTTDIPPGTALTLSARFGNTPVPDGTWSAFTGFGLGSVPVSGSSRYIQYQATLSGTGNATPALKSISFSGLGVSPLPSISASDVSVTEGSSGTTYATFMLSLSAAAPNQVSVSYATTGGTATAGTDFTSTSGIAIFPPGTTTIPVLVPVVADAEIESAETFLLTLSAPVNATLAQSHATATIVDDDASLLSIGDASVLEGQAGTTNALFTVSLSTPSSQEVTVGFATSDGTAQSPQDYTAVAGTVTFPVGVTTRQIAVPVVGDTLNEPNETFTVTLSAPVNAAIADGTGTGTIVDNDSEPSLAINDITVTETDAGTVAATFTVTLSPASGRVVTVDYTTANGAAVAPADYTAASGTLTFSPGQTAIQVSIAVLGDVLDEPNETFLVNLTSATNATIADSQGIGTIVDNDPPAMTIGDVTVTEGNTGTVNAVFVVSLSSTSTLPVSVKYATIDGTALSPADYTARSGTLTIAAGSTTGQITVPIVGDTRDEPDETFTVVLSAPVNGTIAKSTGIGTIADNDSAPSLVINNVSVQEGDSGTINAIFTVTLSAASGQTVTVNYATADVTATAPSDYAATTGTLTFTPGVITQSITVAVNGDMLEEPNETFQVNLSSAVNATIADSQGVGTIVDNDPPTISIANRTVTEGNAGTLNAAFTVSLSFPHLLPVSVNYATADGTATTPADYTAVAGTLTIPAGATSGQINVPVVGDLLDEANETFTVTLSSPVNGTLVNSTGVGTITDNDATPTLVVNDVTVTEPDAGTTAATFTVALSAASGRTVTVNYATANATATAPADYTATSGTLTFAPGTTTQQVVVTVVGDLLDEADETFQVRLSTAVNASIADATGVGTIVDNDATPTAVINDVTITEANTGTRALTFTVTLSAASGRPVTIAWATADNTAVAPGDYVAATGTLTFSAGVTTRTITVNSVGDTLVEPNETFFVNLSNGVNVTIADSQGIGTILNND